MLTRPSGRIRDWIWFALAALLPALAVSVIGLRALEGEQAAIAQQATQSLEANAERLARAVRSETASATRALGQVTAPEQLNRHVPAFSTAVVLDENQQLLVPEPPPKGPEDDPTCRALANDPKNHVALLERCPGVRGDSGLYLWPALALEHRPSALLGWLEGHAALLSTAERELLARDVRGATQLAVTARERALALLSGAPARHEALREVLSSPPARQAIARGGSFETPNALGALSRLDDGRIVGFVVDREALAEGLGRAPLDLPAELSAEVRGKGPPNPNRAPFAEARITEALTAVVYLTDPSSLEKTAAYKRRLLIGFAVAFTAIAFGVAAFLFWRVRSAERSAALRTDFVSSVSHELRTPIASLRMLAELLAQDRVEPDERKEVTDALAKEAARLGDTVDRLLGFSRMAAGRLVLDKRRTRLSEPVLESIRAFEERHPDSAVERELDENLEAEVDAGQIRLVVDNLLANARKYAPEGGPYTVAVRREAGSARIEVNDHGPGISRRDRRRIFEPFVRADDRLSQATEGSGIGLSLVRHVAKAHGGEVWVDSEPGQGARFIVAIPLRET